jgi:phospholipid/cholesterol/gamma-HCH transport system substrate-binding protein
MASSKKTTWAQLRVGIMAAVALALVGILIFFMTSNRSIFASERRIYAYLESAPGIAKGAPVRLNGLLVGNVSAVGFSGDARAGRFIRVEMHIDQRYATLIPADSVVTVGAENLLGSRLIDIRKGSAPAAVNEGGELPADATSEIEDVVRQGRTTLAAAELILKRLEAIVAQVELGKGSIGRLLKDEDLYNRVNSIVVETEKVAKAINSGKGTIGRLLYDEELYSGLRLTMARVDSLLEGMQTGQGTAGKLLKDPALYDETRKTIAEMRRVVEDLNAGKGTAGKLLKDEQLHAELERSLKNVNTLLDNLNSGKGTMGQLLVNQQLYENLAGATFEMQGLMKDFRANPKKFLRIKLGLF